MRTEKTEAAYQARWRLIANRAASEIYSGTWVGASPVFVASWLSGCRQQLRASTFRQYRAAISWQCEQETLLSKVQKEQIIKSLYTVNPLFQRLPKGQLAPATSSHVLKRMSSNNWSSLLTVLINGQLNKDKILSLFLMVGFHTGLRPCEWTQVRYVHSKVTGKRVLVIRNHKDTNERAHGSFRRLIWMQKQA